MKFALDFGKVTNPISGQGDVDPGLGNIITNIITTMSFFGGIFLFIYLVYGGVIYVTSGGDKDQTAKARRIMTNAIIGIIIVAIAAALTQVIGSALKITDILSPTLPTV